DRRMGAGHPGRDFRCLRSSVPPRHRRRTCQQAPHPPLSAVDGGVMQKLGCIAGVTIMAVVASVHAVFAQGVRHGEELLVKNCAPCEGVGRKGESPNKLAPPFRTLGQRYPIESLEESLGEGIMSGHPDMPEFKFDAKDVDAIIVYLKSIQQR